MVERINKPILFVDFDGTLCYDRFWRSLPTDQYDKIQKWLFTDNKEMINDWMRGTYSSEDINDILAENLYLDYHNLWRTFVDDCRTMKVSKKALTKINQLRQHYKTVLITGNMDCFSRFTSPALNLNIYFDSIINSFDEKQLKDENGGEQFLKVVDREQSNIQDSILIDDSVKVCKLFESLGGKAYLISAENDIYSRLREIEQNITLIPA